MSSFLLAYPSTTFLSHVLAPPFTFSSFPFHFYDLISFCFICSPFPFPSTLLHFNTSSKLLPFLIHLVTHLLSFLSPSQLHMFLFHVSHQLFFILTHLSSFYRSWFTLLLLFLFLSPTQLHMFQFHLSRQLFFIFTHPSSFNRSWFTLLLILTPVLSPTQLYMFQFHLSFIFISKAFHAPVLFLPSYHLPSHSYTASSLPRLLLLSIYL